MWLQRKRHAEAPQSDDFEEARLAASKSRVVSIRLAEEGIKLACRQQAIEKGLPYQTYIRFAPSATAGEIVSLGAGALFIALWEEFENDPSFMSVRSSSDIARGRGAVGCPIWPGPNN